MTTAIYPGSFDPITLGHLNIIRRASRIFDKVVVCVMVNSAKRPMFTREERMELIERVVKHLPNVKVDTSDILLAEYVKRYERPVLLKGLRAVSDFESEFQMALINSNLNHSLEQFHSHDRITARAQALGMQLPDDTQLRMVNLSGLSYGTTAQSAENTGAGELD